MIGSVTRISSRVRLSPYGEKKNTLTLPVKKKDSIILENKKFPLKGNSVEKSYFIGF
jgi:hypothetical protein